MGQIPVLLLGCMQKSWHPSLPVVMPAGERPGSHSSVAGHSWKHVHVIRSTEKEEGRKRKWHHLKACEILRFVFLLTQGDPNNSTPSLFLSCSPLVSTHFFALVNCWYLCGCFSAMVVKIYRP